MHAFSVTSVVSDHDVTMAHQAPLSMGFSRQEYWSGLPFPSLVIKYEVSEVSEVKSLSCAWLLVAPWTAAQAALDWVAIAFSVLSLRHLTSSFGNSKQGNTKEQTKIRNRKRKKTEWKQKSKPLNYQHSLLIDLKYKEHD